MGNKQGSDSCRSVEVQLHNETPYKLTRDDYGVMHGKWTTYVPEELKAQESGLWMTESNGLMTGTEGDAYFKVHISKTEVKRFRIHWNNPYAGSNSYSCTSPDGFTVSHTGGSGNNSTVHFKITCPKQSIVVKKKGRKRKRNEIDSDEDEQEYKVKRRKLDVQDFKKNNMGNSKPVLLNQIQVIAGVNASQSKQLSLDEVRRNKVSDIMCIVDGNDYCRICQYGFKLTPDWTKHIATDKHIKRRQKWLETDVKAEKKQSGARGKGKKKNEDDNETEDNKEEQEQDKEEEEATKDDKNDSETTDNKETKKSKKKGSKKKKDKKKKSKKKDKKDKEDDNDENEGNDETKDKKTKKKKSKKAKKSSKKDKKKKDKKSKSKKKSSKKKKGKKEEEGNDNDNDEKEDHSSEQETASKSKRGKKRKHSESAGDESSELEPPQKKRKKMNKSKKSKKEDKNKKEMNVDSEKENEEETEDALSKVLGDMVDIMTGDKLVDPAISPYGYVMSYNSWCSILRNSKTKNKCPFTKQKLTRRSLIKLTVDNIGEYEDQIVNVTEEERKNFML